MSFRRRLLRVSLIALLIIGYVLLAPRSLSSELGIERKWATDVSADALTVGGETAVGGAALDGVASDGQEQERAAAHRVPFRLGDSFGYIDRESGTLLHRETVLYEVTYNADRYINYSAVSQNTVARTWNGAIAAGIRAAGYPHLRSDRLFMIHPQGTALSEWSLNGVKRWERSLPAVITTLAASRQTVAIGLSDGSVRFYSADGEAIDSYFDPAARLPVILGVAASADGGTVAAVSGLDPQRLIVFEAGAEQFVPRRQFSLSSSFRRPIYIDYILDDTVLAFEAERGLMLYELSGGTIRTLSHDGRLAGIDVDSSRDLVALLASQSAEAAGGTNPDSGRYVLKLQIFPARDIASFSFPASSASISAEGGWVMIGIDATMLGLRVKRL